MNKCEHTRTRIYEPHLAGARKCLDCGMVYNPNHDPSWFRELPSKDERLEALKEESDVLATCLKTSMEENAALKKAVELARKRLGPVGYKMLLELKELRTQAQDFRKCLANIVNNVDPRRERGSHIYPTQLRDVAIDCLSKHPERLGKVEIGRKKKNK